MARRSVVLVLGVLCLLGAFPAGAAAVPTLTEAFENGEWVLIYTADENAARNDDNFSITLDPSDVNAADGGIVRFNVEGEAATVDWNGVGTAPDCVNNRTDADTLMVSCGWTTYTRIRLNMGSGNDTVSKSYNLGDFPNTTQATEFHGGTGNDYFSEGAVNDAIVFNGGADNDSGYGYGRADTINGGPGNDTLNGSDGADTIHGEDGADNISAGANTTGLVESITGGPGSDFITGTDGKDSVDAGPGADTVFVYGGDDSVSGGDGRDRVQLGVGKDGFNGGEGFDEIDYSDRAANVPLRIALDDRPNDGAGCDADATCEGDNVAANVEDVIGGSGNDTITGTADDNVLNGGPGFDTIDGLGGFDNFIGGDGNDKFTTRDGNREPIDCGGGSDSVIGDEIDQLVDCETSDLSADFVADADGDGVPKPTDCNDSNASIKPGATDTPDNGVDEDCNGVDAVNADRDADGIPRPTDCDDSNKDVRPGGREVFGNRIDENCNGVAEPFKSISSTVPSDYEAFRRWTIFYALRAREVPAGATVRVTCRGRGCPRRARLFNRTVTRRTRLLSISRGIRNKRLRPRTRLEIRITAPETIGRLVRYTIRAGKLPTVTSLCLPPGSNRGVEC